MKQRTLAGQNGFERYTKKTRRALFLEEMEQVVPWAELCALIEPVYPKAGQGRPSPTRGTGCCRWFSLLPASSSDLSLEASRRYT